MNRYTVFLVVLPLAFFFGASAPAGSSKLMAGLFVRALVAAYDQNTGFNVYDSGQIAGPLAFVESGPFVDYGSSFHA
ncbi:MAG TPA: hypothetical protein VGH74_19655, partial [Planctomycetaceae bacterium]